MLPQRGWEKSPAAGGYILDAIGVQWSVMSFINKIHVQTNTESVQCLVRLHNMNSDVKSGCMTASLVCIKFSANIMQKWPTYGQKCDFQYGSATILDFVKF